MSLRAISLDNGSSPQLSGVHTLADRDPFLYKNLIKNHDLHDSNFAFVSTELAKLHEVDYSPIWFVTYYEDIPAPNVGGGFVDYIEYHTINWASIQEEAENFTGNNANVIPRVNASANQNRALVFTYQIAYDLNFIEIEKLDTINFRRSLIQIYETQITAGYELFTQNIVYQGAQTSGSTGLFNNPNVKIYAAPTGVSGGSRMEDLTDGEVISFFNGVMAEYLVNTNHNLMMLPDTFLLPLDDSKNLSDRFSQFFNQSLRNYLLVNNFGSDEVRGSNQEASYNFRIKGRAGLNGAGTNDDGRIVVYRKDARFLRFDIPYALQMFYTGPNLERMAFTTLFVAQISELQMMYNDAEPGEFGPVTYWDLLAA